MKSIAEHMADILKENGYKYVWKGDIDLIEECADRAQMKTLHPLRRINNVLAALDRSSLFEKKYLLACNLTGGSSINRRFRCFVLKDKGDDSN